MGFQKIETVKISDQIVNQFKEILKRGEFKPGDELPPERILAELLGVSRPPLREALNVLQKMGFVEIRPRRHILVKSVIEKSLDDPLTILIKDDATRIFELLEVRRVLEAWAASVAAERATPSDILQLGNIVQQDKDNLKNKKEDPKTDADFHVAISMAAHNIILSHLMAYWYQTLWETQKLSREKIFKKEENRQLITQQHLEIFEAIKSKDGKLAGEEASKHIDFVEKELKKVIFKARSKSGSSKSLDNGFDADLKTSGSQASHAK